MVCLPVELSVHIAAVITATLCILLFALIPSEMFRKCPSVCQKLASYSPSQIEISELPNSWSLVIGDLSASWHAKLKPPSHFRVFVNFCTTCWLLCLHDQAVLLSLYSIHSIVALLRVLNLIETVESKSFIFIILHWS